MTAPSIRAATLQDVSALADLVNFAGEGMPLYLWAKMARTGEDPWAVGRARASRDEGSFSYRNASVIDEDGGVASPVVILKIALDESELRGGTSSELRPGVSARAQIACGRKPLGYVWLHEIWDAAIEWLKF